MALIVGAVSVGILASAVVLIRFCLNLPRDDRAPYIGGGMIISVLALSCLWPAARAALSHSFGQGGVDCSLTKGVKA